MTNCQIGVSLILATNTTQLPVDFELYLPRLWADDPERRAEACIPDDVVFETKPEQALKMIRRGVENDLPRGVVLGDTAYGDHLAFRRGPCARSRLRAGHQQEHLRSTLLVFAVTAVATAIAATRWVLPDKSRSMGRPRAVLSAGAFSVPLLLSAGVLAANYAAPETWMAEALGWDAHAQCLCLYAAFGGALLFVFLRGFRPLDPVAPGTTGAALGAAAGAWVTLAVGLQCPGSEPAHVLVTHVWPVLLLIPLGAALGQRMLAVPLEPKLFCIPQTLHRFGKNSSAGILAPRTCRLKPGVAAADSRLAGSAD